MGKLYTEVFFLCVCDIDGPTYLKDIFFNAKHSSVTIP